MLYRFLSSFLSSSSSPRLGPQHSSLAETGYIYDIRNDKCIVTWSSASYIVCGGEVSRIVCRADCSRLSWEEKVLCGTEKYIVMGFAFLFAHLIQFYCSQVTSDI